MIAYIKGKIIYAKPGMAIIETGGVGYRVNIGPVFSFNVGQAADFFIHEHIREETDDLYGFTTYDELILFEKLISVNGVGPKAGMSIMTVAPPERIISAVTSEDVSFFISVPGIGKKVAARIILDLKSKLGGFEGSGVIGKMDESVEIVDVLVSLGYSKPEIGKIAAKMSDDLGGVEEKIRWYLKNLSKQ